MTKLFVTLLLAVNFSAQFIFRHIAGVEKIPLFDVATTLPIILMLLPAAFKKGYAAIRKKFEFVIVLSLIPYLLAYAYTFFLIALMYAQSNTINLYQAARFPIKAVYYIVLAGILLLRFREQALEMFCEAVIMSYAVNIMYGFAKIGVGGVLQYLATMAYVIGTGFNTYFEMHDLGLSVELLIIYQLFMREKTQWLTTSLLALVMVFCYKRIAIFAMIVTMIFYVFIRRKGVFTRDVKVYGTFIAILAACFIYTWFIASDVILELAARYGFDFSNRIGIFGAIRNFYEWSVFFLGHGLYFTRSHFQETYRLGITGLAGLHNDILTTYVDLGFIGSFLWFFYQLWIFPKSLEKHFGHETSFVWCILMVYAYCVYTTDNTQTYSMFQTFIDAILMLQIMKHSGFISAKSAS